MKLREYQERAVLEVREAYKQHRSVCLVAPTGAGKTVLGLEIVRRTLASRPDARVLWMAHRRELVEQTAARAVEHLGEDAERLAVRTVQGLAVAEDVPAADFIVWDEAHHTSTTAPHWHSVLQRYPKAWRLGLTATPERGDGSPLGDCFDGLVVAASYSELIAAGHLVGCEVLRPDEHIGSDGLAVCPIEAWQQHAGDRQGFLFADSVANAYRYAEGLTNEGIPAEVIEGNTNATDRHEHLERFKQGDLKVLVSVYVLTEGVDVPAASVCLLARNAGHAGTYLQMVGRVLRPYPGKAEALLIDLAGTSHKHGGPTDDREYSLDGEGIAGKAGEKAERDPDAEPGEEKVVHIYNAELRRVYAGAETPISARRAELERLMRLCRAKG